MYILNLYVVWHMYKHVVCLRKGWPSLELGFRPPPLQRCLLSGG